MLYFKQKIYVIDVSQSVEMDHPYQLDFLKRDLVNVNRFFEHKHVDVFPLRMLFSYVTGDEDQFQCGFMKGIKTCEDLRIKLEIDGYGEEEEEGEKDKDEKEDVKEEEKI